MGILFDFQKFAFHVHFCRMYWTKPKLSNLAISMQVSRLGHKKRSLGHSNWLGGFAPCQTSIGFHSDNLWWQRSLSSLPRKPLKVGYRHRSWQTYWTAPQKYLKGRPRLAKGLDGHGVWYWRSGIDVLDENIRRKFFNLKRWGYPSLNTQRNQTYLRQGAVNKLQFQ